MIDNGLEVVVEGVTGALLEDHDEPNPLFPLAIAICLFVASIFFTWQEFRYYTWGREATAEIVRVKEGVLGESVRYRWSDPDDGIREDSFLDEKKVGYIVGESLEIEYLPGVMASRLRGTPLHHKIALAVFAVSLLIITVYLAKLWRQGNRELKEAAERTSENGPRFGTPS